MRILVACETSGIGRRAFSALGHDVWSCDLLPAADVLPVEGFPRYLISPRGEVFSARIERGRISRFHKLVPGVDAKGYLGIALCAGDRRRQVRVHRLVAESFLANPDGLPCVRHLDGNPSNNHADNLAWGTYLDNEEDKRAHGTWESRRVGKLSKEDRKTIRDLRREGWSSCALADLFDVSRPTITRLLGGVIWGNDHAG